MIHNTAPLKRESIVVQIIFPGRRGISISEGASNKAELDRFVYFMIILPSSKSTSVLKLPHPSAPTESSFGGQKMSVSKHKLSWCREWFLSPIMNKKKLAML